MRAFGKMKRTRGGHEGRNFSDDGRTKRPQGRAENVAQFAAWHAQLRRNVG